MKLNKETLKQAANTVKFQLKDKSPYILTGVSTITFIGTVVLACKKTLEVEPIIDEHISEKKYAEDKKELTKVYLRTGKKLAKHYYKPIILGTLSLTSMFASTNIFRKRNLALTAAFTAVDNSFKAYRKNVIDRYGADVDEEMRFGIKEVETEEETTDKKGNVVKKKVKTKEFDPNAMSPFSVFYQAGCLGWTKDPQRNKKFLLYQQQMLNDTLQRRGEGGWVTMNEVYKSLGIEETADGMTIGWVNSKDNLVGDNRIEFNIFTDINDRFVNHEEPVALLDFNYDGNIQEILKDISKKRRENRRKKNEQ